MHLKLRVLLVPRQDEALMKSVRMIQQFKLYVEKEDKRKAEESRLAAEKLAREQEEEEAKRQQGLSESDVQFVMTCLCSLFSTVTGVCAWAPSVYEGQTVVIIYLPFLIWVLENAGYMQDHQVRRFFGTGESSPHPVFDGLQQCGMVDFNSEEFRNALKTTPFKIPRRERKMNNQDFAVFAMTGWMQLIRTHNEGDVELDSLDDAKRLFGTNYAFAKNTLHSYKSKFGGLTFTEYEQTKVPAMGVPWWKELFSPVVRECFGLEDSECTHVAGCERVPGVKVNSHAEVKALVNT